MKAKKFLDILEDMSGCFYTGVPDSLLKPFLDALALKYGVSDINGKHIVAANEGAAVGLAAGHFLASKRPAVVYMQNSGIGNAVNPICSLLHKKIYSIPVIFVIGWRGEPGVKDEPQHAFQGEITLKLLELLEIPYTVVSSDTAELEKDVDIFRQHLEESQSVAFIVKKDALNGDVPVSENHLSIQTPCSHTLSREAALKAILGLSNSFICVCTTGKLSREVFEIRESQGAGHSHDFLTVGSMGHSISIAQSLARQTPDKRVLCLDGDGAMLMHMGSLAVAGTCSTSNLVHIVFNNGAHESVGGMPTACTRFSPAEMAETLGYKKCLNVKTVEEIIAATDDIAHTTGPVFVEVMCNTDSRSDLGRPGTTPAENKAALMKYLESV